MLKIETRPLTEEERERIVRSGQPARMGCVSAFAFYGMFLILIPAVFGGLIGAILKGVAVPEGWAYGIGFLIVFPVSIYLLAKECLAQRARDKESASISERVLAQNEARVIVVDPIQCAWEVSEMLDFGPGYLLQGSETHFIFFSTDGVPDFWPDEELYLEDECPLPGNKLTFTYLPVLDVIQDVTVEGPPVTLQAYPIPHDWLGVDLLSNFAVLTKSQVDPLIAKARAMGRS